MLHSKSRSKKLDIVKNMPPLFHTVPGQEFNIESSEVVRWLISQPGVLHNLWDRLKQSGYVEYDPETSLWTGVDYDNLCPHRYEWDDCPDCRH